LGSGGAVCLASALEQNRSLRHLHLGGNGIGSEGALALAAALRVNTSLELLTLSSNAFGVAAHAELVEAASTLPQLKLQVGVAPTSQKVLQHKSHSMPDMGCLMDLELEHEEYAGDIADEKPEDIARLSPSSRRLPSNWHLPDDGQIKDSHKALEQLAHAFGSGAQKVNRWHRKVQQATASRIAMQRLASALNTGTQEMASWEEQPGWESNESNPRHSFLVVSVAILPSGRLTCTSTAGREIVNFAPGTTLHKLLSLVSKREQVAEDRIRVVNTEGDLLNERAGSLVHHMAVDDLIHQPAQRACSAFAASTDFDTNSTSGSSASLHGSRKAGNVEPSCWSLAVRMSVLSKCAAPGGCGVLFEGRA
jgi:hypothetical protein